MLNVEILQENLSKSVSVAQRFVQSRSNLPVLQNILISANSNVLKLTATNIDTVVEVKVPAKINKEGSLAIPAKLFNDYLQVLSPGKIMLDQVDKGLFVSREDNNANFSGIDPEEYPVPPVFEETEKFKLTTKQLNQINSFVTFASSNEEARPVLSAILFLFKDKQIEVVATDGYRLSRLVLENNQEKIKTENLLIPVKVFLEVVKLTKDYNQEKVVVGYSEKQKSIVFNLDTVTVQSKLIEGNFPPYEKILPEKVENTIIINRHELQDAVKAAALFAQQSGNIIRWSIKEGSLSISANASNVGKQESAVSAETGNISEDLNIAFNSRYLQDVLNHLDSEEIEIGVNQPLMPVVFKQKGLPFEHVIMPVRTND